MLTNEQIIERAVREGLSEEQITAVLDRWFEANADRIGRGHEPVGLEFVMPRYVPAGS